MGCIKQLFYANILMNLMLNSILVTAITYGLYN